MHSANFFIHFFAQLSDLHPDASDPEKVWNADLFQISQFSNTAGPELEKAIYPDKSKNSWLKP